MLRRICATTVLSLVLPSMAFSACLPAALCTKVTGLADVALGTWGGSGDLTSNYTMCAYVQNDNESNYTVTGSGTGAGSAYIISSGAKDIPVTVEYEESGAGGWVGLTPTAITTFANPNTADEDCAVGGNSAKVRVTIPSANMDYATAGTYTGTVTLVTSPD
ncbi:MAG: hypothetical protein ACI9TY_000750 [Alphaproteobacteria bacterium]|jgi:hypothetical protein